jgi:transcriptional regulator with XRE-family HTH domain
MNLKTVVADNVRGLRYKLDISQEKLAEYSGIHRNYVGAIEREEVNVALGTLEKLAKALHVQPYLLLKKDFYREFEYEKRPRVKKRWERS